MTRDRRPTHPPRHRGRCQPWHRCSWCPCALDDHQTHDPADHDRLAADLARIDREEQGR